MNLGFWWDAWRWAWGELLARLLTLPAKAAHVTPQACVTGTYRYPRLRRAEVEARLAGELLADAPLLPEHCRFAWRLTATAGGWRADWAIAPTSAITDAAALGQPVLLPTPAGPSPAHDAVFQALERTWRWRRRLLTTALLLLALLPVAYAAGVIWRERTHTQAWLAEAQRLERAAAPAQAQLSTLRALETLTEALLQNLAARIDWTTVWHLLAAQLPDGAWIDRWEQSGAVVRISGVAPDVNALIKSLSEQPEVIQARLPVATTRDARSQQEAFTLELQLRPNAHATTS